MFDLDRFIEDCIQARREDESHKAVREVVEERPFDIDKSRRIFRESNERFALGR